eukprot:scaffold7072_cov267-Pinguiococcus_pyrenoidosus.AAC.9
MAPDPRVEGPTSLSARAFERKLLLAGAAETRGLRGRGHGRDCAGGEPISMPVHDHQRAGVLACGVSAPDAALESAR